MEQSCVCVRACVCVSVCVPLCDERTCACMFVCSNVSKRESRRARRERGREEQCANPYSLWRIQGHPFMFCQPSVNQFPIKVVLNSAVIPISSSRFPLTVSEVLKQFPCLFSDLLQCVQHALPGQTHPVKSSNNAG